MAYATYYCTQQHATTTTEPFVLTVTDNVGCVYDTTINVTINYAPSAEFIVNPTTICLGGNVDVTYDGTGTTSATYTWDFDGATIVSGSGQGPYVLTWDTPGTYDISLTVSESGCTSAPYIVPVTVNYIPIRLLL